MELKKVFKKRVSENDPLELDYIALVHTGVKEDQNFSTKFVSQGQRQGWLSFNDAKHQMILKASPEDLVYTVKREPGCYCCHCGQTLDAGGEFAKNHIQQFHAGQISPNKENPSGYQIINHFECVLDSIQHEKYKARPGKIHRPLYRKAS